MSEEKTVPVLIRDFFGVVALAFTVFGFMALMTFSPDDPSFNKSVTGGDVANSVGMVGAYFSDGLARVFGSGSFFFPVIMAFLGWALIRGKDFHNWLLIMSSGILFLVGVLGFWVQKRDFLAKMPLLAKPRKIWQSASLF